ncbi:MAG: HEAT repeat domain-containing protein, partial [Verrucomicrobiota bacterium]
MKNMVQAMVVVGLWFPVLVSGQEGDKTLEEALKTVMVYEAGHDGAAIRKIEQAVAGALNESMETRLRLEKELLQGLRESRTREAGIFFCRQLRTLGTDAAVPVLKSFLNHPELGHSARFALGRIPGAEAEKALYEALKDSTGDLKLGIIDSLARRGYEPLIPDLVSMAASRQSGRKALKSAAMGLGFLGGSRAVEALEALRPRVAGALLGEVEHALLRCAESMARSGDRAAAGKLYRDFYEDEERSLHWRVGGLQGLSAQTSGTDVALLAEAAGSGNPGIRAAAVRLLADAESASAGRELEQLLGRLKGEQRVAVIGALLSRETIAPSGIESLAALAEEDDVTVRSAALAALGQVGGVSHLPVLLKGAGSGDRKIQGAARGSLQRLQSPGMDDALMKALIRSGNAEEERELVRVLAGRQVPEAIPLFLRRATAEDDGLRQEAIRSLGNLARAEDLASLVQVLAYPHTRGDRGRLESAITSVFQRVPSAEVRAAVLLERYASVPTDAQASFLRLLGKTGSPLAYPAVRSILNHREAALREAAVGTLADWSDGTPTSDLLKVAEEAGSEAERRLALRGYLRMAEFAEKPAVIYRTATALAKAPAEKKQLLAGLARSPSVEAVPVIEALMGDPEVKAEAAAAALQIARRLRKRPDMLKPLLEKVEREAE